MNLNIDISKYMIPTLGALCVGGALLAGFGMRMPYRLEVDESAAGTSARMPEHLELNEYIPTMEEVVAKHLFVPERKATGENAFPDLVVKGVYVGNERNAVFSLKSKPEVNLRVWQGDEDAALGQVVDERDPRKPIADFLGEWQIRNIDFAGVTVEHLITGEVETYAVDYAPQKKVKDNAQAGYGQGLVVSTAPVAAKAPGARTTAARAQSGQPRAPAFSPQAVAGRVGAFMQRMTPQQRQQFMQQLNKQQAQGRQQAAGKQNGKSAKNGSAKSRKNSKKRR